MYRTYCCADLYVVFANGVAIVHSVEGSDLVYAHWRHLQESRNLVHDADTCEAVLALAEVEQRHNGGLLVLRWVPRDNLLDEFLVLSGEFERNFGIVLGSITMLSRTLAGQLGDNMYESNCIPR